MKKMMTYSEANTILGSSLTPNNRCICKKTARDNHADPAPLASFTDNRLVPVDYVNLVEYDITFKYDNNTTWKTERYAYGATPNPGTPSLSGQIFDGWSPAITAVTGPATYVATWHAETVYYDVTFVSEGTTWGQPQSVVSGGYATAPSTDPTKSGYTFAGWSIDGTNVVSVGSTPITGNTTFTAVFTQNGPVISTAGPFAIQGGADYNEVYENLGSNGDPIIKYFQLTNPTGVGTNPIDFTLHITGWIYDHSTGTFTEISSNDNATITVQNYRRVASSSGYDSTGTTLTMSQNLYDLGLRWFQNDSSQSLFVNTLSQTYYYLNAAEHSSLWCPNHDRNWLFTFNVSCDDLPSGRTLSASTGLYKGYATLPGGTINNLSSDSRVAVETSVHLSVY